MSAPIPNVFQHEPLTVLPPELRPSVEHLVIEDDQPVDNVYAEKQMRLLTRPLYSSWPGPAGDPRFLALANVGMFFAQDQPPLVPDVLLSLGVQVHPEIQEKRHRSYFFWEFGKAPDVVIEIVSNQEGGELSGKKEQYARIGIPIYVVWDPLALIGSNPLQAFGLFIKSYEPIAHAWIESVGLGLQVWHGAFEQLEADWLRWCDRDGQVIPLGVERAEKAEQRAGEAEQRAEQAEQRAGQAEQRAEQAEQRAARLAAQLRQLGIEPTNGNP